MTRILLDPVAMRAAAKSLRSAESQQDQLVGSLILTGASAITMPPAVAARVVAGLAQVGRGLQAAGDDMKDAARDLERRAEKLERSELEDIIRWLLTPGHAGSSWAILHAFGGFAKWIGTSEGLVAHFDELTRIANAADRALLEQLARATTPAAILDIQRRLAENGKYLRNAYLQGRGWKAVSKILEHSGPALDVLAGILDSKGSPWYMRLAQGGTYAGFGAFVAKKGMGGPVALFDFATGGVLTHGAIGGTFATGQALVSEAYARIQGRPWTGNTKPLENWSEWSKGNWVLGHWAAIGGGYEGMQDYVDRNDDTWKPWNGGNPIAYGGIQVSNVIDKHNLLYDDDGKWHAETVGEAIWDNKDPRDWF